MCEVCPIAFLGHKLIVHFSLHLQKDKEDLEEVSMELELADEDELVPWVSLGTS